MALAALSTPCFFQLGYTNRSVKWHLWWGLGTTSFRVVPITLPWGSLVKTITLYISLVQ